MILGVLPDRAACKIGGTELHLCVLVLKAGSICLCKGLQNSGTCVWHLAFSKGHLGDLSSSPAEEGMPFGLKDESTFLRLDSVGRSVFFAELMPEDRTVFSTCR